MEMNKMTLKTHFKCVIILFYDSFNVSLHFLTYFYGIVRREQFSWGNFGCDTKNNKKYLCRTFLLFYYLLH